MGSKRYSASDWIEVPLNKVGVGCQATIGSKPPPYEIEWMWRGEFVDDGIRISILRKPTRPEWSAWPSHELRFFRPATDLVPDTAPGGKSDEQP